MTAQVLDRTLTCWRIGDAEGKFPIFDATGSTLYPGRWNRHATPAIYAAANHATALLEKLVHGTGMLPPNQHSVKITIPRGLTYEMLSEPALAGWDQNPADISQKFGAEWIIQKRSLLLIVPSIVSRPDQNIIINPAHPEFSKIEHSLHQPVYWDKRLFQNLGA